MNSPNIGIEHRRTVHGGDDSALSVELSPIRFEPDGSVTTVHGEPDQMQGVGVYIRNPSAFHVQDFGPESVDPDRRVEMADVLRAGFKYADALADHLGCTVDSGYLKRPLTSEQLKAAEERAAQYRERCEAEAMKLLKANGFSGECGGGGCLIMSLYLPNGAYIWATNEEGAGNVTAREFCLCVYSPQIAEQGGEPLLDLRPSDADNLLQALRMALAAARTTDAALVSDATFTEEDFREGAADAAAAVRERADIIPDGFREWTDGIAQGFAVYDVPGKGCIILSDLDGQECATAESWSVAVFTGTFDWGSGSGTPEAEELQPVHQIDKGPDALTLEAAISAARAMLDKIPAFDPSRSEPFNSDDEA